MPQRGVPGQDIPLTLHYQRCSSPRSRGRQPRFQRSLCAQTLQLSAPTASSNERAAHHDPAATRYSHQRRHTRWLKPRPVHRRCRHPPHDPIGPLAISGSFMRI